MSNHDNRFSLLDVVSGAVRMYPGALTVAKNFYNLAQAKGEKKLSIGRLFELQAERHPNRPFLIFEKATWTYSTFNDWVNRIAHLLKSRGVGTGDCVALLFENRPELLACALAAAKLGAVAGLINHNQRGEVLAHSLHVLKPKMVIVSQELVGAFEPQRNELPRTTLVYFSGTGPAPYGYENLYLDTTHEPSDNLPETKEIKLKQKCYYVFTSGTTGMPKAAAMTHLRWYKGGIGMGRGAMQLTGEDVLYCPLPLYHNNALTVALSSVIYCGSTLAISRKFSTSKFWDDIRAYKATSFIYVGELCRYLLNAPPSKNDLDNNVRVVIGNGMRPEIWDEFQQRFGIDHICEFYGASECNVGFVNLLNLKRTAGFCPMAYAIVRFDPENEEPIADDHGYLQKTNPGDTGLLLCEVSEKTPFDGYTDKKASESKLFRNVFVQGDCWFNTGDLVRDQGFRHIAFVDRVGDTFRWKGENVATTEVEGVVLRLPQVAEAVVYGVKVPNSDGRAGMLSLTLEPGTTFDPQALTEHLQKNLPSYAIPLFVKVTDEHDSTSTFKIKKSELKKNGYQLSDSEPIYALLNKTKGYELLTPPLYSQVESGHIRF